MGLKTIKKENNIKKSAIELAKRPSWFGDFGERDRLVFEIPEEFNDFVVSLSYKTPYKKSTIKAVLNKWDKIKKEYR